MRDVRDFFMPPRNANVDNSTTRAKIILVGRVPIRTRYRTAKRDPGADSGTLELWDLAQI
jgi:hypothetical protein